MTIKPGSYVRTRRSPDVAYYVRAYATYPVPCISYYTDLETDEEYEEEDWSEPEYVADESKILCVMVGDDHIYTYDIDDLVEIDTSQFCTACGQIGCGHG